jgi:hypothetical protein
MSNVFRRFPESGGDYNVGANYNQYQLESTLGLLTSQLYNDSGDLTLKVGRIGIDNGSSKGVAKIDTEEVIDLSGCSNENWIKIEMAVSGTAPVFTATDISGETIYDSIPSTFINAYDAEKNGYYITSTKRTIGIVYKDSEGVLLCIINTENNYWERISTFNGNYNVKGDQDNIYKEMILIENAGIPFSLSNPGYVFADSMTSNRIVYADANNDQLRAYDFDGLTWSLTGSALSIAGATWPAVAALSSSRIALYDPGLGELRAYDFDGSNWSLTGSGLAIAGLTSAYIAALSSSRIALIGTGIDELRAYDFDGSNWSLTGSGLAVSNLQYFSITALTSTRIVISNVSVAAIGSLQTYDFDGSNWSTVGAAYSFTGGTINDIESLSSSIVLFANNVSDYIEMYNFINEEWVPLNVNKSIDGFASSAIAKLSDRQFAFVDGASGGQMEIKTFNVLYPIYKEA